MSGIHTPEIIDLPINYNDNRIVLLARDPHWLYAYWEITDDRKNTFTREFGCELWDKTVPVLKVTNVTDNTSNYIKINDFSNSWYINVDDSGCSYIAEIGRRISDRFFIGLATSNYVATPADGISADTTACFINYRDLRNGRSDLKQQKTYEDVFRITQNISAMPGSAEFQGAGMHGLVTGPSSAGYTR